MYLKSTEFYLLCMLNFILKKLTWPKLPNYIYTEIVSTIAKIQVIVMKMDIFFRVVFLKISQGRFWYSQVTFRNISSRLTVYFISFICLQVKISLSSSTTSVHWRSNVTEHARNPVFRPTCMLSLPQRFFSLFNYILKISTTNVYNYKYYNLWYVFITSV